MSVQNIYVFNNALSFNTSNVEIVANKAQLSTTPDPTGLVSQNFTSQVGFILDTARAEVAGGMLRQKDLRPPGATFYASFENVVDALWSDGSNIGSAVGGAQITANKLNLTGGGVRYVEFPALGNVSQLGNKGCVRLKFTANYNGTPSDSQGFFSIGMQDGSTANRIELFHHTNGSFFLYMNDRDGNNVASNSLFPFTAVAGQEGEIELGWDFDLGKVWAFGDGNLIAEIDVTGDRDNTCDCFVIGNLNSRNAVSDMFIREVIVFDESQHTVAFTPVPYGVDFIYEASLAELPDLIYNNAGAFVSIDGMQSTQNGNIRYIVDNKWHNGTVWVASNGTFSEANTITVVDDKIDELVLTKEGVSLKVVFETTNTRGAIDILSLKVTGEKYFLDGYIEPSQAIQVQSLESYEDTRVFSAGVSDIKICLRDDGVFKYWSGTAWATSDGSYAQSNSISELISNFPTLDLGGNSSVFIRWNFHTTDEQVTPELVDAIITFEYGAVGEDIAKCLVYGHIKNISGDPVIGATLSFRLSDKPVDYKESGKNIVWGDSVSVVTNDEGYFSIFLVLSSALPVSTSYILTIKKLNTMMSKVGASGISFTVPDSDFQDITDLVA